MTHFDSLRRRYSDVAATSLAAVFFLFVSISLAAQSDLPERNSSERQLFEALNRERAAQGLSALQWDSTLFKAARQHALRMVNLKLVEHQLPNEPNLEARLTGAGARFSVIAENIAVGPNPQTIHSGWMDSPGHRKNILDPRFTSVGIAAVRGSGGLFAVQDFSQKIAELSLEEQEQKIAKLLAGMGIRVGKGTEDARKTCERREGFAGNGARSMIRFDTPELNKLPEGIERKIRARVYGRAEVGACRATRASGFTPYRIAILFY